MLAARDAYRRIAQLLDAAPRPTAAMKLPAPKGALRIEKLTYVHPGADDPALRNIDLALEPGECLGLIGPTATGKTTLARLLVGNLRPLAGHVRLDGADVAAWAADDLGRYIGYLPQDVELFAGTVRENIARMEAGAPEAVIGAAQLAGVHEMILRLPHGYESEIGDAGAILSGGQRQRVALARAVYGEPTLIVLDEPNASLDQDGDQALIRTMNALRQRGATVVVVTHRPSILRAVDKILVLGDEGTRMFGPADEILLKVAGQLTGTREFRPQTQPQPLSEAV